MTTTEIVERRVRQYCTPAPYHVVLAALTTGQLVSEQSSQFRAPRGTKMIHAGGRAMHVRTPGERVLHLPNGSTVKVSTDDSGVSTQVEENEALHAVVRPKSIRLDMKQLRERL